MIIGKTLRMNEKIYAELFQSIAREIYVEQSVNRDSSVFNIFKVLQIEAKEVIICRLLGELLNPQGSHDLGEEPLKLFLKLLDIPWDDSYEDLKSTNVSLEEYTDDGRRTDIVIHMRGTVIPIEVKIWAADQKNQLFDYYEQYEDNADLICYLTPDGKDPSEYSRGKLDKNKIKCISFVKDIIDWLNSIIKIINERKKDKTNLERTLVMLEEFKEVIEDMCKRDNILKAIKNVLSLDEDSKWEKTDNMRAILSLLEINEDRSLWKIIRNKYLQCSLNFDHSKYELIPGLEAEQEAQEGQKGECVFTVRDLVKKRTIAWIRIETNIYIVAKKVKEKYKKNWKEGADCYWRYISPKNSKKKFSLNKSTCDILDYDKIDIMELLEQIELD